MLTVIVDSVDDLPAEVREHYKERDGKYVLELDGAFSQMDRDALQTSLQKERGEHKETKKRLSAFGSHTPESIEELTTKIDDLQLQIDTHGADGEEERNAKIEELAERRALAKIRPLERQLKQVQEEFTGVVGERDNLIQDKRRNTIKGAVLNPALLKEAGIVEDAAPDVELWALSNFEVDDSGNVVSRDTLGTPGLSPKDVFADMRTAGQRRHWFGATKGGGAAGGRSGEQFDNNPFSQTTFSLTNIARIVKTDPQRAIRMAKAACSKDYDAMKYLPPALRSA